MAPSSASLLSDTYIKVYPVPTTDYLRIESTLSEPIEYGLINIAGVKVRQGMFIHSEVIDVENLASGIYLLGFSTKNGMQIKKVIIE
ncbi:MAG TPA: hypothetical protein DDX92_01630 [Flavobacteriales bacterium]|nr:hypothetical protein [Flavobacteriales bacterium]